jgi:cell division protein FtsB
MRGNETQSALKRYAQPVLFLVLVLLCIHDIFGDHGFIAMGRTRKEIEQMRGDIARLNDENRALASQVTALKSDPRMIEQIARDEMGLARPGEVIFKVPSDSPDSSGAAGASTDKPQP